MLPGLKRDADGGITLYLQHESPGAEKLGRTLSVNPGSEYADVILRGAIVDVDRDKGVRRWQIVQG